MSAGVPSPSATESSARLPAWLRPVPLAATVMVFAAVMAYYMTPATYRVNYRAPKFVDAGTVGWVFYLTVAFCIPVMIIAAERFGSMPWRSWEFSPAEHRALRRVVIWLFIATMAGYLIWLAHAAGNGFHFSAVSQQLSGSATASSEGKSQFTTISGVTTMTQFGIPVVVIGALLWPKATLDVRIMTATVFCLGVIRALIASERLAMYEVGLPILVIVAARMYTGPGTAAERQRRRLAIKLVPVVAVPVLVLTFAGFEYTRSWQWWRHHTHDSFMVFETKRLAGYYSTSLNNAQMMRDEHVWPQPGAVPWFTWYGVWNFPIFKNVLPYKKVTGGSDFFTAYDNALNKYTVGEFTNFGGLTDVTFDYGWVGGAVFVAILGGIVGGLYASFAQRRRPGLLFYPIFVIFLVELPREFYITAGRALPALGGALIAAMVLRRVRHRENRLAQRSRLARTGVGMARSPNPAPPFEDPPPEPA